MLENVLIRRDDNYCRDKHCRQADCRYVAQQSVITNKAGCRFTKEEERVGSRREGMQSALWLVERVKGNGRHCMETSATSSMLYFNQCVYEQPV